jgi:hypothetical protein
MLPNTLTRKPSTITSLNLVVHGIFCVVFVVANDLGLMLYKQFVGSPGSRGYMPGMITRVALLVFVTINFVIALAPWRKLKFCIAVTAAISYSLFLLPAHPLRALFYLFLTGTLSMLAIVLAEKMVQTVKARSNKAMESK